LEAIILEMVLQERRLQPRLGGKKLYFMLCDAIHGVDKDVVKVSSVQVKKVIF